MIGADPGAASHILSLREQWRLLLSSLPAFYWTLLLCSWYPTVHFPFVEFFSLCFTADRTVSYVTISVFYCVQSVHKPSHWLLVLDYHVILVFKLYLFPKWACQFFFFSSNWKFLFSPLFFECVKCCYLEVQLAGWLEPVSVPLLSAVFCWLLSLLLLLTFFMCQAFSVSVPGTENLFKNISKELPLISSLSHNGYQKVDGFCRKEFHLITQEGQEHGPAS